MNTQEIGTDIQPITKSSRLGLMEKFCIMFESAGATLNVKSEFLKVKRDWNIYVPFRFVFSIYLNTQNKGDMLVVILGKKIRFVGF